MLPLTLPPTLATPASPSELAVLYPAAFETLTVPFALSAITKRPPSTLAVTCAVPLPLMASSTSFTVATRERSIVAVLPPESVTTIRPRSTPCPLFSSESETSVSSRARADSNVMLVTPTAAESRFAKPRLSICCVETSLSTMNEYDPTGAFAPAVAVSTSGLLDVAARAWNGLLSRNARTAVRSAVSLVLKSR